jgi:GGDEF domain-containing protein
MSANPNDDFETLFDQLKREYRETFGADFEITGGPDTPSHQKFHEGFARDVRSRTLRSEQRQFLTRRGGELGLGIKDYSYLRGPTRTSTGTLLTGPHIHFERRRQASTGESEQSGPTNDGPTNFESALGQLGMGASEPENLPALDAPPDASTDLAAALQGPAAQRPYYEDGDPVTPELIGQYQRYLLDKTKNYPMAGSVPGVAAPSNISAQSDKTNFESLLESLNAQGGIAQPATQSGVPQRPQYNEGDPITPDLIGQYQDYLREKTKDYPQAGGQGSGVRGQGLETPEYQGALQSVMQSTGMGERFAREFLSRREGQLKFPGLVQFAQPQLVEPQVQPGRQPVRSNTATPARSGVNVGSGVNAWGLETAFNEAKSRGDLEAARRYAKELKDLGWEVGGLEGGSASGEDPFTLARQFEDAKGSGDNFKALQIGTRLKNEFNWELGTDQYGNPYVKRNKNSVTNASNPWPYVKPPQGVERPTSQGTQSFIESGVRQREDRERRERIKETDDRGALTQIGEGALMGTTSALARTSAGVGRLIDDIQTVITNASRALSSEPTGPVEPTISARDARFGESIQEESETAAEAAEKYQQDFGSSMPSQIGFAGGSVAPLFVTPGGAAGLGVLTGLQSYGSGKSLGEAILSGVAFGAGVKGAGKLVESLEGRIKNPFGQYIARSIGQEAAIRGTTTGTNQDLPDTPQEVARDLFMALGLGLRFGKGKGKREPVNRERRLDEDGYTNRVNLLNEIISHPDTHPQVKRELENLAYSNEINLLDARNLQGVEPRRGKAGVERIPLAGQAERTGLERTEFESTLEKLSSAEEVAAPRARVEQVLEPSEFSDTTGGASGRTNLSNEELSRSETFYKVGRGGGLTYLGRQPDATLKPGEAVVGVGERGETRIVNDSGFDSRILDRPSVRENLTPVKNEITSEAFSKASPELREQVIAAPLRAISEASGLGARAAEKGRNDVIADGTREFSPEAVAVKKGMLEQAEQPTTGRVDNFPVKDIQADPDRFQYKVNGGARSGASGTFGKDAKFSPAMTKDDPLRVWLDPADQKTYIVDGHNRLNLAKRDGVETVPVEFVKAQSADEARAVGAIRNILKENGTPKDTATFVNDSRLTPEQVERLTRDNNLAPSQATPAESPKNITKNITEESGAGERRVDVEARKRISEMSPDEMRRELLTDELTGLDNQRAYTEAPRRPVQVRSDIDGLKWVNDNLGHDAGDELIKAKAQALRDEGVEAYRSGTSGDEFFAQFDSPEQANDAMERVRNRLSQATIEVTTPNGQIHRYNGASFSFGLGDGPQSAEGSLQRNKSERAARGERSSRGGRPGGLVEVAPRSGEIASGVKAQSDTAAQRAGTQRADGQRVTARPDATHFENALDGISQADSSRATAGSVDNPPARAQSQPQRTGGEIVQSIKDTLAMKNQRGSGGPDTARVIRDLSELAMVYVRKGTEGFKRWTAELRKDFGLAYEEIKPHILRAWRAAKAKAAQVRAGLDGGEGGFFVLAEVQRNPDILNTTPAGQHPLDKVSSGIKAGLLSGIEVTGRNITSTASHIGLESTSTRTFAAVVDRFVSSGSGRRAIAGPSPKGMAAGAMQAATRGMKEGWSIMRKGATAEELQRAANSQEVQFKSGVARAIFNFPFRFLTAQDRVMKNYAMRDALQSRAKVEAMNEIANKVTPKGRYGERVNEIVREAQGGAREDLVLDAWADAEVATFNNQSSVGRWWEHTKAGRGPVGRFVMDQSAPFVNVPVNVFTRMFDYLGVGAGKETAKAVAQRFLNGEAFPSMEAQKKFSLAYGRLGTGVGLVTLGAYLKSQGLMTGYDDESDHPASIRVGGRWYRVDLIPPVGPILALGATAHKAFSAEGEERDVPGDLAGGLMRAATSAHPMARPTRDLAGPLVRSSQEAMKGEFGQAAKELEPATESLAGRIVPSLAADVARSGDVKREIHGPLDAIKNRLPGARQTLPPRVDVLGEPIKEPGANIFDVFQSVPVSKDPLRKELDLAGANPKGIRPRPGESSADFQKRAASVGHQVRVRLNALTANPDYQKLGPQLKRVLFKDTITRAREEYRDSEKGKPLPAEKIAAFNVELRVAQLRTVQELGGNAQYLRLNKYKREQVRRRVSAMFGDLRPVEVADIEDSRAELLDLRKELKSLVSEIIGDVREGDK